MSLYLSDHINLVSAWLNSMHRLLSVFRKSFYSLFKLTGPGAGGGGLYISSASVTILETSVKGERQGLSLRQG
jgi:hypothetical protein